MSMKLLPASVNPVDPSQVADVSNGLVPLASRAITTGQIGVVPSTDVFTRSSREQQGGVKWIDATVVEGSASGEDSQSDASTQPSGSLAWEYVSGWAGNSSVESTVAAHYLAYSGAPAIGTGRLINLYA